MQEIEIYSSLETREKIGSTIDFNIVKAGEKTKKTIFIENKIDFPIQITLSIFGEDISLITKDLTLQPRKTVPIDFEVFPKLTSMKPIRGELKVSGSYVIE